MTDPLCAAIRITLSSADPQDISSAAVSSVETPVVVSVRVDTPYERFGGPQSELHAVFAAHLVYYKQTRSVLQTVCLNLLS